ncbi:unnamed protein product [Phaedon cochleariae]|uniref:Uncharacterized protein n=1 Tax=Phaedon cochleariae TaxID=80249 RepID=A0A9N9X5L3_PHACE|nr:unnamed protein product [Phaedon cochleariae]
MTANDEHSNEQSVSNLKMFTSGMKNNQRCNGQKTSPLVDQIFSAKSCNSDFVVKNRLGGRCTYNNGKQSDGTYFKDPVLLSNTMFNSNSSYTKVKTEPEDDFESQITAHSIIDIGEIRVKPEIPSSVLKSRSYGGSIRATRNEVLQRISADADIHNHYQKHWFSASLEMLATDI